jgi:hypothetical protein
MNQQAEPDYHIDVQLKIKRGLLPDEMIRELLDRTKNYMEQAIKEVLYGKTVVNPPERKAIKNGKVIEGAFSGRPEQDRANVEQPEPTPDASPQ